VGDEDTTCKSVHERDDRFVKRRRVVEVHRSDPVHNDRGF
jgi:hypothetical protein